MQRLLFIFTFILYTWNVFAFFPSYDEMKKELNEQSLPLINIIVPIDKVNSNQYTNGEIEIIDYHGRTNGLSMVHYFCKYRYRGSSSLVYEKKSFAVKLIDENGNDIDENIFGIREDNNWILDAMAIDRIRMRNRICFDIWNEISKTPYDTKYDNRNGTKGFFVEVFINGEYHGLYCLSDKVDRKLLGLKKVKINNDSEIVVHGLMYKGISWQSGSNLLSYKESSTDQEEWNAWELQYPDDYPCLQTWQPLMDLINFCSYSTSQIYFNEHFENYFFINNLVDYVVFTNAFNIRDTGYKNTILSTVDLAEGHRYLITVWDMDTCLGGEWNGSYNDELVSIDRFDWTGPFNRLQAYNINGWKEKLIDKWNMLKETLFSEDNIQNRINEYAMIFKSSGAWRREYEKWNNNPVPLKENIDDELKYVFDWYHRNYNTLSMQWKTSDINTKINIEHYNDTDCYSINGQRMNIFNKGIYIKKGKKYLKHI